MKDYTEEAKEKEAENFIRESLGGNMNISTLTLSHWNWSHAAYAQKKVKEAVDGFEKSIALNVSAKEQIEKLKFELQAADKENERLTKENQQKETELKELKEGVEKIKALKIVEVEEITDTLLTK